jgi:hypothetical protein
VGRIRSLPMDEESLPTIETRHPRGRDGKPGQR